MNANIIAASEKLRGLLHISENIRFPCFSRPLTVIKEWIFHLSIEAFCFTSHLLMNFR